MNSKRKAEIQRRLSMSAVPKPPDGLADRIKGDIPKYLEATEIERRRFSRSIALNLRVAASVILIVTSLLVTMKVLSPAEKASTDAYPSAAVASAPEQKQKLTDVATESAAAVDELRVEISEETPRPVMQVAQMSTSESAPPAGARAERQDQAATTVFAYNGAVGGSSTRTQETVQIAEAAPAQPFAIAPPSEVASNVTHPAAPVAPAPAPAAAPTAVADAPVSMRSSSGFVREAVADDLHLAPKSTVFGISVDPAAFDRVKSTIERGARPVATAVNVEALVNYFAGAPKRVRRDVQLEAEGSPAPVESGGRRGIVRFTVDTKTSELAANSSVPPIATNARVDVEFNPRAVASSRRIGVDDSISSEATLLSNMSVTGLYEVELKPSISANTRIATVTLRYTAIADGREKTRFVVVRASDFARKWTLASRRHRLASLGAVWGESLKGSGAGSELATKAEALAVESPNDARARALATVTRANSEQQ
jgi:von Willebrand factor